MDDPRHASPAVPPEGEIFNVVLGTAGHIDHGKSALVQALTGIHPDRLKEEQERGITIDLGFAPLVLSSGMRVGIIDVPGHERFIKNMVAGATGIDFVLFVVAADDGVMAQTREHLQILKLLGIPDGLVALTKVDLVEPAFVDLVREELRELVAGSCLEGKPVLSVSSKTGAGIPELRAALERALAGLKRRAASGPFRMPIQRVFAKEGFGTVITGVPMSGSIAVGDSIGILPPGFTGRVKGMHAYQRKISRGQAGHSQALNVTGLERQAVHRGMVAVTPDLFQPTALAAAHLTCLADAAAPLKHRAEVRFHAGTVEIMGKVLLLEGDQLARGAEGYVQVWLEEPTVLCPGDRFILRRPSPVETLAGGVVLDNVPAKRKRLDPDVLADLAERRTQLCSPRAFLAHLLDAAPLPKTARALRAEMGLLPEQLRALLKELQDQGRAVELKAGESYAGTQTFQRLARLAGEALEAFFREHPALGSVPRPELKSRLERALRKELGGEAWFFEELVAALERRGTLRCAGNEVALAGRERKLDERWAGSASLVEAALLTGGLAPPEPAELAAAAKLPAKALQEVLRYLLETGKVVEAAPGLYFHREAYEKAVARVKALFQRTPELTVSEIRKDLGMNRKFVVPLVEYLDKQKITVRAGDVRRLA